MKSTNIKIKIRNENKICEKKIFLKFDPLKRNVRSDFIFVSLVLLDDQTLIKEIKQKELKRMEKEAKYYVDYHKRVDKVRHQTTEKQKQYQIHVILMILKKRKKKISFMASDRISSFLIRLN